VVPNYPTQAVLGWPLGTPVSMHVYLSTSPEGDVFSQRTSKDALPSWVWGDIKFGDWNEARVADVEVPISEVRSLFSSCTEDSGSDTQYRACRTTVHYGLMCSW
jgi:hypothetical protein